MKLASNPQTTKTADFPSSAHISQISQGVCIISIRKKPGQPPALGGWVGAQENAKGAELWVLWKPLLHRHPVPVRCGGWGKGKACWAFWRNLEIQAERSRSYEGRLRENSVTSLQEEDGVWQM